MAFHQNKCNVLSVSKNKNPVKYNYSLHGQILEHEDKAKYLGVTIQSDLKWHSHINNITKSKQHFRFFAEESKHQFHLSKGTGIQIISTAIFRICLFRFAEDINKLESIQRRAARYVTGRQHNTSSVSDMYNILTGEVFQTEELMEGQPCSIKSYTIR